MNSVLYFFLSLSQVFYSGLPPKGKPFAVKTYNLFYIDNSHVRGFESFSPNLLDVVSKKVDSVRDLKNSDYIALFSSNGQKPDFVSNYRGAKGIIDKLSNGYTDDPFSPFDKSVLIDKVSNSDISDVKAINVYFFLTESYLSRDLLKSNAGLLLNILPEELRFLLNCDEEKVNVFIYFPSSSNTVKVNTLMPYCSFINGTGNPVSKIKFHVQPI